MNDSRSMSDLGEFVRLGHIARDHDSDFVAEIIAFGLNYVPTV